MRLLLRIAAVLFGVAVYTAAFAIAVALVPFRTGDVGDLNLDRPTAAGELSDALTRSGVVIGASEDAMLRVCGFPPRRAVFRLSHAQAVTLARCLHSEGHLSTSGFVRVQSAAYIEITGGLVGGGEGGISWAFFSSPEVFATEILPRPWWESALLLALWLGGGTFVVWLVGFRLPLWRRPTH